MSAPKIGDRVRVTFDMDIVAGPEKIPTGSVRLGGHDGAGWWIIPGLSTREIVSVEVLPPPEPDFFPLQYGDVVQASATTYVVSTDGVRNARRGDIGSNGETIKMFSDWLRDWHHKYPTLTCELLVRNGKAV